MRVFVLEKPGQATPIDSAPYPLLEEPHGVTLELVVVALCSSDINTIYGSGSKKPDNLIFGHECIMRVKVAIGHVWNF